MSDKVIVRNLSTGKELLWRSVKIRKSLDEICHTMELEIPSSELPKVARHNRVRVCVENKLFNDPQHRRPVTTVLIDEIAAETDSEKHTVMIVGRSPARDIIDSSWTGTGGGQTLWKLVNQIGKKFNVYCGYFPSDKPDPTKLVSAFTWKNESPWTKLFAEADNQGFIFTSNEIGNLYLWPVAGTVRSEGFHITEKINVRNIKWTENGAEQFNRYVVTGGGHSAVVIDDSCPEGRELAISVTSPNIDEAKLKRRATTEMRRRKETKAVVSVSGWGLSDEQIKTLGTTIEKEILWIPNSLIPVSIPSLGLQSTLLLSEAEYFSNKDEEKCDLTLVNKEAYL